MNKMEKTVLRADCDRRLKWTFHASSVTNDTGLLASWDINCHDEGHLRGLAGYENTNEANGSV